MQAIGLSPALGAFLAGVVLADSEYRHALETDIEPFKGLLLGLFFISVGMSIDFDVLGNDPITILGLVAGLVIVKLLVLALLGRIFGLGLGENVLFTFLLGQGGEFAFVLFQFAVAQGAIPASLASQLIVVVALSMVLTPLLMIINDRVIQPRLQTGTAPRSADVVDDSDSAVIIVGYGRFGQIVGRLLQASGIKATILDNDPDHLGALRRFGHKAFYGDGSRMDVLHAAGADRAKLIVLAMNDAAANVEAAKAVRREFSQAKTLARARDRNNAFELMAAGVEVIRRETFDAALSLGREALTLLGMHPYEARRQADTFSRHDRQMLQQGFEFHEDEASMIALVHRSREQLEGIFRADHDDTGKRRDAGWGE
jgi:voltage-gated potassium channel Kch